MAEIFRRVEKKYLIDDGQYSCFEPLIRERLVDDEYGETSISNIYFDTKNFDLVRRAIEKPIFRDKVRLRSYNLRGEDDAVFLEIKRKFNGVTAKRRIETTLKEFRGALGRGPGGWDAKSQVERELRYYFELYGLEKKMFVAYRRNAYYEKGNMDLRITFDSDIVARNWDLSLESGIFGEKILSGGIRVMEIKSLNAMPMWLVKFLNERRIYPCNFTKYGEAYKRCELAGRTASRPD